MSQRDSMARSHADSTRGASRRNMSCRREASVSTGDGHSQQPPPSSETSQHHASCGLVTAACRSMRRASVTLGLRLMESGASSSSFGTKRVPLADACKLRGSQKKLVVDRRSDRRGSCKQEAIMSQRDSMARSHADSTRGASRRNLSCRREASVSTGDGHSQQPPSSSENAVIETSSSASPSASTNVGSSRERVTQRKTRRSFMDASPTLVEPSILPPPRGNVSHASAPVEAWSAPVEAWTAPTSTQTRLPGALIPDSSDKTPKLMTWSKKASTVGTVVHI